LTLTDVGGGQQTLAIYGSFDTNSFHVSPLGTAGSSIVVGRTISGSYNTGIYLSSESDNPVLVTGTIAPASGTGLTGKGGAGNSWTVDNAGEISANSGGAVVLGPPGSSIASGMFVNEPGAAIYSPDYGVYINGPGSITNMAGGTIVGKTFSGMYILGGPGTIVNAGKVSAGSVAAFEKDGGSITNLSGGILAGSGGVVFDDAPGTLTNAGTVIGNDTNANPLWRNAVTFRYASTSNRLIVDPGAVFDGNIRGGNGAVELASGSGTLSGFGTSITNFSSLQFDSGASWNVVGQASSAGLGTMAISGFDNTDTIDVTDFLATSAAFSNDTLTLTGAGGEHATLNMVGSFAPDAFHVSPDGSGQGTSLSLVACFLKGTRVLTPDGEVAVEGLAIGDSVITTSGATREIKWIGRRSYDAGAIGDDRDILPIRFKAGCLDDDVPKRDLCISSKHALLIDRLLVPAELLINGTSIQQYQLAGRIEYYHLELDSHDAIFAEGTAAETYVDCDNRDMFHNAAEFAERYPDDPNLRWRFCAPRLEAASPELVPIRDRIDRRAGAVSTHGSAEALLGHLDWCTRRGLAGWAFDSAHPEQRVRLEFLCDGQLIGHVMADRFRPDLLAAGYLGDGCHSFHVTWPIRLDPLTEHVIEVRRAVDGTAVPGSPVRLPPLSRTDTECLAILSRCVEELADAATDPSELDALIASQMAQVDLLLATRARLDGGERADSVNLRDRWSGLLPVASVQAALKPLRPRALFVDAELPAPEKSGGDNAALAHMQSLMRLGFDVCCVATYDLDDRHHRARWLRELGVNALLAPWYGSVEEVLRRNAGSLDVVYLHRAVSGAAYGRLVRQFCPQALLIYSLADLHHLRLARQGEVQDRPELMRAARYWQAEELAAVLRADVVITHSTVEAMILRRRLPNAAIAVVPWVVPVHQAGCGFDDRRGVIFIGNFGHSPNVDAVHWLSQEIAPLVWQKDPAIEFRIVGNGMAIPMRALDRPRFQMSGSVSSVSAELDKVRLTVAPLRYGAGLKAKVVESLAAGVPCIGTPTAFEGMDLPASLASCVAATPHDLAAAIVRHHSDRGAFAAAAAAGRSFVATTFSEEQIDARMEQALAPFWRNWRVNGDKAGDLQGSAASRSGVASFEGVR
jgi:glycosyltransferase involved in cell wall biosynthesis